MRRSLVVLGGSGDLTGRLLLPSLAHLLATGALGGTAEILAVSQQEWDDAAYRDWARERLTEHAGDVDEPVRERLAAGLHHVRGDVTSPEELRAALDRVSGVPVVYLALPNTVFLPTLEALVEVGLPEGAQVVVEKPFGRDRADAAPSTRCCTVSSRSRRSSGSTTSSPCRQRSTSWGCASPTGSSNRCGTPATSSGWRSSFRSSALRCTRSIGTS